MLDDVFLIKFQFDDKGTEHPITLDNIDILASLYLKVNELKDAEYWLRRSFEGRRRISYITKNYFSKFNQILFIIVFGNFVFDFAILMQIEFLFVDSFK